MSAVSKLRRLLGIKSKRKAEPVPAPPPPPPQQDWITPLQFARPAPFGPHPDVVGFVPPNTINWVIPDVGIGGGGHLNIFRMVANLERLGFDCRIIIDRQTQHLSNEQAKQFITQHYLAFNAPVYLGEHAMPPAWFTFASSWETAYTVRNFQTTRQKCYFVQDFEPYFFAAGSHAALAEQTYRFGFLGITAGGWLAERLTRDYGMRTVPIGFSYDKGRYQPLPRSVSTSPKRVFFYARPHTPRRGFELGMLVLAEVVRRIGDIEVVLAGCDASMFYIPFKHVNAGVLALDDLPRLYSDCDVALVLSHTNLSLLPLELMACGCPVVSNRGANVEWLLNSDVAALADPDVQSLSDAVVAVLSDEVWRLRLIRNGLALAHSTDWAAHAQTVANVLRAEQGR